MNRKSKIIVLGLLLSIAMLFIVLEPVFSVADSGLEQSEIQYSAELQVYRDDSGALNSVTPSSLYSSDEPLLAFRKQSESCDPQMYYGIEHCTEGGIQILKIDPKASQVQFETVLARGYDRNGEYGECRDVNVPQYSEGGLGCESNPGSGRYPSESVQSMVQHYPGAVAAFNADLFSHPEYLHGPEGLTVKNGERFDGTGWPYHDQNEVKRGSLSVSQGGDIRIGIVNRNSLPSPTEPWAWNPDPYSYYNSVGGLPILVRNGNPVDIGEECSLEGGNCPASNLRRARTAVGRLSDGRLIVVVVPESPGATLEELASKMVSLGAVDALNLDGGGSSQLWYDGYSLVSSSRQVAESVLVFSKRKLSHQKPFRSLLPWYYLISTGDARVTDVYLDGHLLFEKPACAKARWINPGDHTISFDYEGQGNDVPEVEVNSWPFVSPVCAAPPAEPPPTRTPSPPTKVDSASFLLDITLPDGTIVSPGQALNKVWRVRNSGNSTWDGYKLVFVSGDQMGAPSSVSVPYAAPGDEVDISVPIKAPTASARGDWQIVNRDGTWVRGGRLWIDLGVAGSGSVDPTAVELTCVADCPDVANPGEQFHPTIRAKVNSGQLLESYGDMLRNTDGNLFGSHPHIAVEGTVHAGGTYDFTFYADSPITAPTEEGTYETRWQIWRDEHWDGQELTIKFDVRNQSSNHRPNTPSPRSPGDWHVEWDGSQVELCAQHNGDPDGDAIAGYQFQVDGANTWDSGDVGSDCVTTSGLGYYTYGWKVRVKDSHGAWSDWSDPAWRFTIHDAAAIQGPDFYPASPSPADTVKVWACSNGGTMKYWVNLANDGTDSGQWWQFYEGPICPDPEHSNPDLWPGWQTRNYTDGPHLVRVDNGLGGTVEGVYTLQPRRPAPPELLNPPDQSYQNSRTVLFTWDHGMFGDYPTRADHYVLKVSTNPDPDQNPILNVTVDSGTTSYQHTFDQDYPVLYWKVAATNEQGVSNSIWNFEFGIDRTKPASAVDSLPQVSTETAIPVSWGGSDNLAGIRWYDVQYKDGERGEWVDWQQAVSTTIGIFRGFPGHTYYFRARALDRAGNLESYVLDDGDTYTTIDPTAAPSTPWWNPGYAGKRNILVVNNDTRPMPAGYPVRVHFDNTTTPTSAELYAASKSAIKGDDFRVVYNDTTQLNRYVQTFTSSSIDIWFKLQVGIPSRASDGTHYQLYYDNASAVNPPGTVNDIFPPVNDGNTIGLWHFQDGSGTTIVDSSGHGRHATVQTQTGGNYEWIDGKFGSALRFYNQPQDGNGAWAEVSNGSLFALTQMSVEAWVRVDVHGVERTIVSKRHGTEFAWQLFLQDGKPSCEYNYRRVIPSGDHLTPGVWTHVACTYDGNTLRVYKNGQVVRAETISQGALVGPSPLRFGKNADHNNFLNGAIQHIRISNVARTSFSDAQWAPITSEPSAQVGDPIEPPIPGNPDLAVLDLSTYQADSSLGSGVIVQAIVRNEGDGPTQNGFYTDVYADHLPTGAGDYTGSIRFWVNDPIEAGATVTLTTVIDNPAPPARDAGLAAGPDEWTTTLYVQADSAGLVGEPDEANNISSGVEVCVAGPDTYEGDDTAVEARSITVGETQTHNFDSLADEDWVKFTASAGDTYVIETLNLSSAADTYLYLYDSDGSTLLAANDDYGGSLASRIEWEAPATGTYYVLVKHWNPNVGGCGTIYGLSVSKGNQTYLPLVLRDSGPPVAPPPTVPPTSTPLPTLTPLPTSTPKPTAIPGGLLFEFSVPAYPEQGMGTGITVNQGDLMTFQAQGEWCWGGGTDCSDPDGTPGRPGPGEGPTTLDGEPFGKLIGRVDDWLFPIGSYAAVPAQVEGELILLMNDRIGCYGDNSGEIPVEVRLSSAGLSVPAQPEQGVDTGLIVASGEELSFHAWGEWCWGGGTDCSDPDGTPGRPTPEEGPTTLDGEPFGKLIGRVGDWLFPIGSEAVVTMEQEGRLVLLMNDRVGYYGDNSGSVLVEVSH